MSVRSERNFNLIRVAIDALGGRESDLIPLKHRDYYVE